MKRGRQVLLVLIFLTITAFIVAQAALAEKDGSAAPGKVLVNAQDKLESAKKLASEKVQAAKEKVQGRKEAAREKAGEKLELVQDKRETAHEKASEKREVLKARVAAHDAQKVSALDRERLNELSKLSPDQAKAKLATLKVVKADESFKARPIAVEKLRERKKAFETLKSQEGTLKDESKEHLKQLMEKKDALRRCGNETSNDCSKKRGEAIEKAKEAALKIADRLIAHLSKLKEKIMSSENMPDEESAAKSSKIDAAIAEIGAIKQKITSASTKEEFNDAAREIKQLAVKAKRLSERHSQGLLRAEIIGVIHRAEVSEKKLDCALSGLEGTDTSSADAMIAEFSSTMGSAREKLKQAKELLESDDEAKISDGKSLIREARDIVKRAHGMLEQIRKEIHAIGGKPCQEQQELVIGEEE